MGRGAWGGPLEVRRDGEASVALDAVLNLVGGDEVDVLRGGARGARRAAREWRRTAVGCG